MELSKYKAALLPLMLSLAKEPVGTCHVSAVSLGKLSKTIRAYYEVSSKKNSFRPDKLAPFNSTHEAKDTLKIVDKKPDLPTKPAPTEELTGGLDDEEEVFCNCSLPYRQGELMFKCEGFCDNWFHPGCVGMLAAEIERQKNTSERWYCPDCLNQAYDIMINCGTHKKEAKKLKFK
jgi:hypothetical protein